MLISNRQTAQIIAKHKLSQVLSDELIREEFPQLREGLFAALLKLERGEDGTDRDKDGQTGG
jgi:broad specificity phosphatase PhoE